MDRAINLVTHEAIARRQISKLQRRIAGCELGLQVGKKWATEEATHEQLQRLDSMRDDGSAWIKRLLTPPVHLRDVQPYACHAAWIGNGEIDLQQSEEFWSRLCGEQHRAPSGYLLFGFASGTLSVWDELNMPVNQSAPLTPAW